MMPNLTISRRQFLRDTVKAGLAVTLANVFWSPATPAYAQESLLIPVPMGLESLGVPAAQQYMAAGKGPLWISGRFLNAFRNNLSFENLPIRLQNKYHRAGAEYKSFAAARGLWESVPDPVRAAGPETVWKFHKGKDWSHIVPRSVGGPATADNGVWWSSIKNRRLGANEMSIADLADARAILRSEAIRVTIVQTLSGMVKGALLGVLAGALLACLECGLEYAEGDIEWSQMVDKVVKASIFAGLGGLIITGVIIGISLLFPFMIPIFAPIMFALQVVSVIFLLNHLSTLAQGWWEVLDGEQKLADFTDILENAQGAMRSAYNEIKEEGFDSVREWLQALAKQVGIDNVWESIAARTKFVMDRAGEFSGSISDWGNLSDFDAGAIGEIVARVVASEFEGAISTSEELLENISAYRDLTHRSNVLAS